MSFYSHWPISTSLQIPIEDRGMNNLRALLNEWESELIRLGDLEAHYSEYGQTRGQSYRDSANRYNGSIDTLTKCISELRVAVDREERRSLPEETVA